MRLPNFIVRSNGFCDPMGTSKCSYKWLDSHYAVISTRMRQLFDDALREVFVLLVAWNLKIGLKFTNSLFSKFKKNSAIEAKAIIRIMTNMFRYYSPAWIYGMGKNKRIEFQTEIMNFYLWGWIAKQSTGRLCMTAKDNISESGSGGKKWRGEG